MGTPSIGATIRGIQEPHRRRLSLEHPTKLTYGHPCPQQSHLQDHSTTVTMEDRTISLARRKELTTSLWNSQTSTTPSQTLQNHQNYLIGCHTSKTLSSMEHPPHVSHQSPDTLHQNTITQPQLHITSPWSDWWGRRIWGGTDSHTSKMGMP